MEVVIIGNSAAGLNALESFRKIDCDSPVTMISAEPGPAYSRVLLPYYLRKRITFENLFLNSAEYYTKLHVETVFGKKVTRLNSRDHLIYLDDGGEIKFDRLLIASGALPMKPPVTNLEGPGIYHMWTLEDAKNIEAYFQPGKRLLVLGSGFISLQAAWSAVSRGLVVTIFELMPRIMPQVLDQKGADILHRNILDYGVDLKVNMPAERISRNRDGSMTVYVKGEAPLDVDLIIVGTGVCPNMGFLDKMIRIDRGILVNDRMETSVPGIFAAGDVAQGPTTFGEPHVIHALWPTAVEQGKVAGANMSGGCRSYQGSLNMNVTQMFGKTVASIGQFLDGEGYEIRQFFDSVHGRYGKVVLEGEIPVGGIVVGDADQVTLLGRIRPLIRQKKKFVGTLNALSKVI